MLGGAFNQLNDWFARHYGSRRGFVRACRYRINYLTGSYSKYKRVDWGAVTRLVFVCKGNICRSAYAESVARSLGVDSISCGIETRTGLPANDGAIRAAALKGIDLGNHKTTQIQSLNMEEGDLFVAMEPWQIEYIVQKYGEQCNCSLLGMWGHPVKPYIEDPYGASSVYFNNCFNYIEKSVHEVARKIERSS